MLANVHKRQHQYSEGRALIEHAVALSRARVASASKDKREMDAKMLMQLHRDQELLADNLNELGTLLNTMGQVSGCLF